MAEYKEALKQWAALGTELSNLSWGDLPEIKLYMDQVITLLGEKLKFYEQEEENRLLTSSMINNYVKSGILPHPEKKKYDREQLSLLIMICMLKSVLSLPEIQTLLSGCGDRKKLFEEFDATQTAAINQVSSQVRFALENGDDLRYLALRFAAEANAKRTAAERILLEIGKSEAQPAEKPAKGKPKK